MTEKKEPGGKLPKGSKTTTIRNGAGRVRRDPERTRARILAAARIEFARRGRTYCAFVARP